ncbi:MAG TPA: hemolysin D, partial [Rhodospirillaceae bacterium]|nr:hemolysin D [Rhodospirillaceae bacterium]
MPNEQTPITLNGHEDLKQAAQAKRKRLLLLGVVPMLAVILAVGYWLLGARYVATENAYVKTDIAKLAAEISGRVIEVRAKAHMQVTQGDVLVRIDPEPFKLAQARAQAEL